MRWLDEQQKEYIIDWKEVSVSSGAGKQGQASPRGMAKLPGGGSRGSNLVERGYAGQTGVGQPTAARYPVGGLSQLVTPLLVRRAAGGRSCGGTAIERNTKELVQGVV